MTTICHIDTGVEAEKYIGHFFKGLGVVGIGGLGGERERERLLRRFFGTPKQGVAVSVGFPG